MDRLLILTVCAAFLIGLCGCVEPAERPPVQPSSSETSASPDSSADSTEAIGSPDVVFGDKFPEVLAVEVVPANNNQWRFNVTLSSTYDTAKRYADGWRVLDEQDKELGIRVLGHDHASEQPFTRSKTIEVPAGARTVFVEGRDQANGWSGQRFKVELP